MKIRDMRKALDSKEISAKELAQTYFERIKKYDDKVKSFITVTEETSKFHTTFLLNLLYDLRHYKAVVCIHCI